MIKAVLKPLLLSLLTVIASAPLWADQQQALARQLDQLAEAGESAVAIGNWSLALSSWQQMLAHEKHFINDKSYTAVIYYEQGRAAGVLCQWQLATRSLQRAYQLDRESGGPYFMAMLELARTYMAQGKYEAAKEQFDQLLPELRQRDAALVDPLGSAAIVDDYALTLEKLGHAELATPYREQAAALRESYDGITAETVKTPYGQRCG